MVDFQNNEGISAVQSENWAIWLALGILVYLRKGNGLWHNNKQKMALQDGEDEEAVTIQKKTKKNNVITMTKKRMRKFFYDYEEKNANPRQMKKTMLLINISACLSRCVSPSLNSATSEVQTSVLWRGLRDWIAAIHSSGLSTRHSASVVARIAYTCDHRWRGQTLKHQVLSTVDETFSHITLVITLRP
jgi:hypothetical protein